MVNNNEALIDICKVVEEWVAHTVSGDREAQSALLHLAETYFRTARSKVNIAMALDVKRRDEEAAQQQQ